MDESIKRNKTYHITTFGCQMNSSDSERVAAVAENLGFKQSEDISNADLIIINSCSIRQKAEDRVMGMGKKIKEFKLNNPEVVTVLTGCMAKREDRSFANTGIDVSENIANNENYELKLKKTMQWLDHVVQIKDIHKLGNYIGVNSKIDAKEYLSIVPKVNKSFFQYIPISTGCNKFCTFCIVPFSRGREIYRPYSEIIIDLEKIIQSGAKEITLLGQNVNSWRGWNVEKIRNEKLEMRNIKYETEYIESQDPHRLLKKEMPEEMMDFSELLDKIGNYLDNLYKETGNKIWLKFTSSHPYDIDEKLVDVIKKHPSIAKQFHFAMQSGSNSVLKRMNRHYSIEDFIEKCEMIRRNIPNVGISTDVIVGFCGETDKEFEETMDVMKKLKFDQAFIAEYSTRKGTVAERVYKDNVENIIKSQRKVILNDILADGNLERNKKFIEKKIEVLIYKKNKLGFIGRTETNKDVILSGDNFKIGDFIKVKINDCTEWSLSGCC